MFDGCTNGQLILSLGKDERQMKAFRNLKLELKEWIWNSKMGFSVAIVIVSIYSDRENEWVS